jgi:hypothetical protein
VSRLRPLASMASILVLACAPAVIVRPGGRAAPTVLRVRTDATRVALLGTMTGWRLLPLERRGRAFELSLDLPPGRYEYRLEVRDNTGVHEVFPEGAERADDGFGGENAVLRIP